MIVYIAQPRPLSQARGATGKSNVFLGASNKKARNIVLHVAGMTDQVCLFQLKAIIFQSYI